MSGVSLIATGDSFITRRLPVHHESLKGLRDLIDTANFRFTNLETTIHNQEGFPAAVSGGTWGMSSPSVLTDLKKYGFNVMAWANNHTLDYSSGGLLATMENLDKEKIIHAGVGKNLADASAPKYVDTEKGRVALISATSTFHESGRAGEQRPDMIGRPGVNPLRFDTTYSVTEKEMNSIQSIASKIDINATRNTSVKEGFLAKEKEGTFYFGDYLFKVGSQPKKVTVPNKKDIDRLKSKINEAKRQADVVVISIHAHEMEGEEKHIPANFLEEASRMCIDEGADAIIGHGPHILRGIEIYQGKPIFYSLGNFIFQNDSVSALPADFYEKYDLDHTSNVSDAFDARSEGDTKGFVMNKDFWESVIAQWEIHDNNVTTIKLYPVELGFGKPRHQRGWPELSHNESILTRLQQLSTPYGTKIDIENGVGIIKLT